MRFLVLVAVLAVPAFADIIPEEVATCRNKAAGSPCTTGDGHAGTCIETSISRPDYSGGVPPTYRPVQMLACVATAKGQARSLAPWLGLGLAFLALLAALGLKGPPGSLSLPATVEVAASTPLGENRTGSLSLPATVEVAASTPLGETGTGSLSLPGRGLG